MAAAIQMDLAVPAVGFSETGITVANTLLTEWGHYLGPCNRPFGQQAWRLDLAGEPIAVAVSASTVSSTAAGHAREDLVELARLCTRPGFNWATRVALRLWRETAAPAWPYWATSAAIAYSDNARHEGAIYRFDGWTRVKTNSTSGGGGTWTKTRTADNPATGPKSLWLWNLSAPTPGTDTP